MTDTPEVAETGNQRSLGYRGLIILIPTRNRSDMAVRSIQSALQDRRDDVLVVVSDNCTEEAESASLREFCMGLGDARVRYLKPAEPLPMTLHYEWAIEQALQIAEANHLAILTDRFLFRKGAVNLLCTTLQRFPDHVVAYRFDSVYDHLVPCKVVLYGWSGNTYRCKTADILHRNSKMSGFEFVPVLLNSVITREILGRVKATFGDCCLSIAPDFGCGFRSLATEDEIFFLDVSLSFNYGRARSNGFAYTRGVMNKESRSFAADLGGMVKYPATPIPQITVVANAVIHEYLDVRDRTRNPKFVEVDRDSYFKSVRNDVNYLEDEQLKQHFKELLGRFAPDENLDQYAIPEWATPKPSRGPKPLKQRIRNLLANETTWPAWWFAHRNLKVTLPRYLWPFFPNQKVAVEFALSTRGPKTDADPFLRGQCTLVQSGQDLADS